MNPYVTLLAAAMEQIAPGVTCTIRDDLSPCWLWRKRREIDVLHLHWTELLYASNTWRGAWRKWLRFISGLGLAKLASARIAYTVHNLEQHEGRYSLLNRTANALLFKVADIVHVHDERTRAAVAERFGCQRSLVVIPHGNYMSYPNTCSREEARARFGIPQQTFVYLALGQIRPYKGIEELLKAFGRLPGRDCKLIIAGHVHDPAYGERIKALAAQDERVILSLAYVPPEEIQYFMNASDVCVLPYLHATTSGAAILAFSFGKPVIVPRLGDFPQLVGERRGLLYNAQDPHALLNALRQARQFDLVSASAEAFALARELDWRVIARQHLQAYAGTLEHEGRKKHEGRER